MFSNSAIVESIGYGLVAAGYLLLAISLLVSFRQRLRGSYLGGAALVTALWGAGYLVSAAVVPLTSFGVFLFELLFDIAWFVFFSSIVVGATGGAPVRWLRFGGIGLAVSILIGGTVAQIALSMGATDFGAARFLVVGQILTSLAALVVIEQIFRNARKSQRHGLKVLCLGIGSFFLYDLLLYSHATVTGELNLVLWGARGFVVAMSLPLIALAISRSNTWSGGMFVSRHIVFHTTTLLVAGVYLTFIGFAGKYILEYGGFWGPTAQIVFFAAAMLALSLFALSERARAKAKVFVSKHFYKNRYDYREEWLRLIGTLTTVDDALPLQKRAIKALADILGAQSGLLYLASDEGEPFSAIAGWNCRLEQQTFATDDSLPGFLASTGWIIDLQEYRNHASRYESLELDLNKKLAESAAHIVPLMHDGALLGFVVLCELLVPRVLNYEDRDLLKTAGKQIASYLAQEATTERLAQSRQFEAYNKLTAYIMHDLKNVMAQQSLVVENAQKHKGNPEFIDDAIDTIKSGVHRINRVIEQLKQRGANHSVERIELGALVMRAASMCADRQPEPRAHIGDRRVWVKADRERLQMAIYHAIRNAQDACQSGGRVQVELQVQQDRCVVVISDTGSGMEPAFVRDRLFRPFDSTKGTQGMGIGAYQIRETVTANGGRVDVESAPGEGTRMILTIDRVE